MNFSKQKIRVIFTKVPQQQKRNEFIGNKLLNKYKIKQIGDYFTHAFSMTYSCTKNQGVGL